MSDTPPPTDPSMNQSHSMASAGGEGAAAGDAMDPLAPPPPAAGPRTSPLLSWIVIIASVLAILGMNYVSRTAGSSETQAYGAEEEALALPLVELQARIIYPLAAGEDALGTSAAGADQALRDNLQQSINPFAATPRLAAPIAAYNAAVVFDDPNPLETAAVDLSDLTDSQLAEIDQLASTYSETASTDAAARFAAIKRALLILAANEPPPTEDAAPDSSEAVERAELAELHALVRETILSSEPAPADDSRRLREELGWFGEVLIARNAPVGSPERGAALAPALVAASAFGGLIILASIGATVGFVLLVIGLVLHFNGTLPFRMQPPVVNAGIYLEAFAVYLGVSTFVLNGGALLLLALGVPVGPLPTIGLVVVSFLAIAWPFLRAPAARGVVATDMGLHRGRGFFIEGLLGIVGYLAGLPIVAIGLGLTLLITMFITPATAEEGPPPVMAHPVILWIADGGWGVRLLVLFLGAVFAPVVEEAIFRGGLYAYMRRYLLFLPAALLVALIFAVIHPQGLAAVPVLGALAVSFALIREWRGSLVGPMVAHALNNGTVLTALCLAFL